jgi:glycosyltransferase involved in cell wall biosynthesis
MEAGHSRALRYSVVIPAYNEEDNLEPLLAELQPVMRSLPDPHEVIVVDDGSTDATPARLRALRERHPELQVLTLARNRGQSAAFAAGFAAARGEVIITLDADLQNDPADIPRLLAQLDRYSVVCGVRRRRRDNAIRRVSSRFANAVRRAVIGDGITDTGCSLKVFPAASARRVVPFDGMHRFLPALLQWQGCPVTEVAVTHRPRRAGASKYNVRNRALRTFLDLLAVRWLKARWLRYEVKE